MLFNKKNDEDPTPNVPAKHRRPGETPTRSVIDPWLQITGNLEGDGELQIDGHIRGDIRCAQLLVGKAATVDGNITADEVVVRGKVNGVIRGNRVTLQNGAHVQSEIFHRRLSIEEGALFEGAIRMRENPMDELLAVAAEMNSAEKAKAKSSEAKSNEAKREAAPSQPPMQAEDNETMMASAGQVATAAEPGIAKESMAPLIGSEMKRIRAQLRDRRPA